ncbi:MAG: hypothetical protein ABSG73_01310 [Candidatus Aminicenantales bacterium]|jgi:hypothetical protein
MDNISANTVGGTATSQGRTGKANGKKTLPRSAACYLFVVHSVVDIIRSMQEEALAKHRFNLRAYAESKEGALIVAECVDYAGECPRCFKNAKPVYFKLESGSGLYVEAPELYEPLWNPESRKLQEMLAAGAPLQARYEQFEKQRRGKEAGK